MTIKLANNIISCSDKRPAPVHEIEPVDAQSLGTSLSAIASGSTKSTITDTDAVRNTISVSVDLMQRLYSGMYILYQTITPANCGPETPAILEHVLQTRLIDPLSKTFPDMVNFKFQVSMNDTGVIVSGGNAFSNTILNAIDQSIHAPVTEIDADDISDNATNPYNY